MHTLLRKHIYRRDSWRVEIAFEANGYRSAESFPPSRNRAWKSWWNTYEQRRPVPMILRSETAATCRFGICGRTCRKEHHETLSPTFQPQDSGDSRLSLAVKQPWTSFIYRDFTDCGSEINSTHSPILFPLFLIRNKLFILKFVERDRVSNPVSRADSESFNFSEKTIRMLKVKRDCCLIRHP